MPAKPVWYGRLDQIIAQLEALPRPWVDRGTVESLLGVGPRRAQQVLAACATARIGTSSLADRDLLAGHLRRLATGDAGHYERVRRHKLAATLEQLQRALAERPRVLVEAPTTIVNQDFGDLPEGLSLAPGRITIQFATKQEALEELLALAMAIGNDPRRFEHLTALSE
jgi:hypothetical protein